MTIEATYALDDSGVSVLTPDEDGLEHVTNHVEDALSKLIEQFKGRARIEALLTSYVEQVQQIEDAAFELVDERTIETAVGTQLDVWGRVVGQERLGLTDDEFRVYIRARIRVNRSNGTADELIEILALLTPDARIEVDPQYPATIVLRSVGPIEEEHAPIFQLLLSQAASGGVRLIYEYLLDEPTDILTFGDASAPTSSPLLGWGDEADASTGGKFAGAVG